ncbi:hypothetical protein PRUPE_7G057200 [Prunus persica]|uniref:Uncharacterized protein n=1 Tax=Prunus persica TaxID=3760 RepID=A0A251N9B8_PRUPE|nr:hypothetical protein PRUPE_7G057200 [Prunus persica]
MNDVGHVSVGKHPGGAAPLSPAQPLQRAASSTPLHSTNGLTLLSNQLLGNHQQVSVSNRQRRLTARRIVIIINPAAGWPKICTSWTTAGQHPPSTTTTSANHGWSPSPPLLVAIMWHIDKSPSIIKKRKKKRKRYAIRGLESCPSLWTKRRITNQAKLSFLLIMRIYSLYTILFQHQLKFYFFIYTNYHFFSYQMRT